MTDWNDDLLRLLSGFFPAQVLHVAVRLGIVDQLAKGPRSTPELAAAVGAEQASLERLLRALECFGVVAMQANGVVELTGPGARLRTEAPIAVHRLVRLLCCTEMWSTWGELEYSVRTGKPSWEQLYGPLFDYLEARPERNLVFTSGMSEGARLTAPGIVEAGNFARFGTVADIGGGTGMLLAAVLAANPGVHGVLLDLPTVIENASAVLSAAGVGDRCQLVPGNFFESVPPSADAYLLKSVIHDWDDEPSLKILGNCRSAMSPNATLLLVEAVMAECPANPLDNYFTIMSDLIMLACCGGKERTEAQYRALLDTAGFDLVEVTRCKSPDFSILEFSILEARPCAGR